MFQDRRRHPRFPVLLKAVAVTERERLDVVCTNVGPAGAFFTARHIPAVGEKLLVEVRASGLGSAQVELGALVARTVPPGGAWPAGFAVTWTQARCTLGADPLVKVLREVLHMPEAALAELGNTERLAILDVAAWLRGERRPPSTPVVPAPRGRESSTVIRRVQGNWSPPLVGAAAPSGSRVPLATPVPRPSSEAQPASASTPHAQAAPGRVAAPQPSQANQANQATPSAPLVQAPGAVRTPPSSSWAVPIFRPSPGSREEQDPLGFDAMMVDKTPVDTLSEESPRAGSERSGIFDSLGAEPSQAIGRRQGTTQPGETPTPNEGPSQSWPVYALAPGERRPVTRGATSPGATADDILSTIRPLPRPGVRQGVRQGRATTGPEDVGGSQRSAPASAGISTVSAPTPLPGERSSTHLRPTSDPKVMRPANVPVTFVRKNQFVPGRIVSIAQQAVAIVTDEAPPELDEPLVVNMPVLVEGVYRTLYLSGKLLQVAQETEQGRRFVMHIERVDEGKHRGAFKNFLSDLQG